VTTKDSIVRGYTEADLPGIRLVERLCFASPIGEKEMKNSGNRRWFGQVIDTLEFGVIGFSVYESPRKGAISIVRLGVHPDFQRFGYGSAFIRRTKAFCSAKEMGLRCDIEADNLGAALFLKANGLRGEQLGSDKYRFRWRP
jgi:GNAT superfamily N-acetyltransferase